MNVDRPRTGEPKSRLTLVPFAGISLIRFRGSRINGLSLFHVSLRMENRHSDKMKSLRRGIMYVNYALTVHNSSGRRNIIAHVIAQVMGDSQGDQFIFQRETRLQRLADIRQRLLKFKIVIVIDGVFEAGIVVVHHLLGIGFQLRVKPGGG